MVVALSDSEVVRRIGSGNDREAESELFRRMAPRVRLYGLRHLRNGHAADDLTQQVLITTLEALRAGRLREPERLASFVLGTCRMTVQTLKERERTVLVMTFYEERTGSDVAGFLGISEANVRVIRHRAIHQLRECMGVGA